MTDAEKQIREAAAAEMRPGEWRVSKHHESRYTLIYDADGFEVARVCYPNRDANARLIAACNPAAIRELLAEHDALKADAERYRWLRENLGKWRIETYQTPEQSMVELHVIGDSCFYSGESLDRIIDGQTRPAEE